MALAMRLKRTGKIGSASYRIVVIHKRSARDGRFIEELGSYDPHGKRVVKLREKQIVDWLAKGAVPSDTVKSLLIKAGIWKKEAVK